MQKSSLETFSMGVSNTRKLVFFCYFPKSSILVALISQLAKKLQQWSLYEVIEDILPFILNTKRPLSDIWLLIAELYAKQFWVFFGKIWVLDFFWNTHKIELLILFEKTQNLFCLYISIKILLKGRFVFKMNGKISSIPLYKDHCCSFFTSWVIKQQKRCILNILKKTPNFGRSVHTLKTTTWRKHLIL